MTHRCRDCPDKRFFSLKAGTIYQLRKAELEVDMSIPTTPEELAIAKAVVRDVTVVTKTEQRVRGIITSPTVLLYPQEA